MPDTIAFTLNQKPVRLEVDGERSLLWVLRTDLELTGTKFGCGEGHCGACTVLVDNRAVRSCLLKARQVAGKQVVTVEGLSQGGGLHPVQKAFLEHDAFQCGFCTPGMVLTAVDFLKNNPHPTYDQIIRGMDQNLCRCGAHNRIIRAIETASTTMKGA